MSAPIMFLARGGDIDGQQRQVLYLAAALPRTSLTAIISESGHLHDELQALGVETSIARFSPWRSFGHMVNRYIDANRLLALASAHQIEIIHAHDVWRAEYARFIARRLNIPYVVHVRGPLLPRDIRKHRLNQADAVIAIAQRYVDDLVAAGVEASRIFLIDDAVDLSLFSPARADQSYLQRRHGISGRPVIGLVGRLSPFKGVAEFLQIVGRLTVDARRAAQFVIAGEWEGEAYRKATEQAVAEMGLQQCIHFLGRCPSQEMPQLLSSMDLLVTLSGGSIMFEAMAMAVPVLSIRSDCRQSVHTRHGHTAWCVDGSNINTAADALARLISDEGLRRGLGAAARDWIAQNLSSPVMVTKTKAVYEKLARKSWHDHAQSPAGSARFP